MPKVSVVMPVYNAEQFVERAARSILCQTMPDLELIAVNDGSTDSSLEILERISAEDDRLRIINQENKGEGGARIAGFLAAQGEWLYSIDADDYARAMLLERCLDLAEAEQADMVIFDAEIEDNQTGEITSCDFACNPAEGLGASFSPNDCPNTLFTDYEGFVWNKLFRIDFIKREGIAFQDVRRTADLLFSFAAMASASKIAVLNEPLYLYRTELQTSASITSDVAPLDTLHAIYALGDYLKSKGLYDAFHVTFVNRAMRTVRLNCAAARSPETFTLLYDELVNQGGLAKLDIDKAKKEDAVDDLDYDFCAYMLCHNAFDTLFFMRLTDRNELAKYRTYSSGLRLGQADLIRQVNDLWREKEKQKGRAAAAEARYEDLAYSRKNLLKQIASLTKDSLKK